MARRTLHKAEATPDRSNDTLLLMPEIVALTKRPEGTLRYWRHIGRGPALRKQGRRLVAWKSDVLAWLETDDNA